MYHSNICEYTSNVQDLGKYHRSTGIEIRGMSPVSDECKLNLGQYTCGMLYDNLPVYTEDPDLIKYLEKIATRETEPHTDTIQMIVFCPMIYHSVLLTHSTWITKTLTVPRDSWYMYEFTHEIIDTIFDT